MTLSNNTTHFFQSSDKQRQLFYQKYHSQQGHSKALLIITHGLGEHSDAYNHISNDLSSELPIDVVSWDLAGHGKSSGQRGYVGDIQWFIKDLTKLLKLLSTESKKPLFLLSHSLGGLITLSAEQEKVFNTLDIKGLIFSNPCTKLNFTPSKWKTTGSKFLAKVAPRLTLENEISPEQLSSDLEYLKIYKADPIRHSKISPRLFLGIIELTKRLIKHPTKIPTLSLLSPKDSVCDGNHAFKLLKNRSQIVFFDNSMHEVLNDIQKEAAISKIKEFLNANF